MQLGISHVRSGSLRQLQFMASEVSEGVIILDDQDVIVWANAAALTMHRAESLAGLGHTIDDYHVTFQIRFRNIRRPQPQPPQAPASQAAGPVAGAAAPTERGRDSLIEITTHGECQPRLHRLRKLTLPCDSGEPRYTLLMISPEPQGDAGQGKMLSALKDAAGPVAVLRCRDRAVVDSNDAFRRLVAAELPHGSESDLAHELIAQTKNPAQLRDSIASGVSFPFTLTSLADQAGERKPALICGQPAEYDGEPCMVLSIVEWDGLQPVVAASVRHDPVSMRAFAARLCAVAPGLAHVLDKDMCVLAASKRWQELPGLGMEAAVGRKITDFMTDASAAQFISKIWPAITSGDTVRDHSCQFLSSTGRAVECVMSATATMDEEGGVLWAVLVTVDATDKQRAEDRLVKLMAISPTPLLIRRLDDNRILDANDAFTALTGYQSDAVIGHSTEEFCTFSTKQTRPGMDQDLRAGKRVQKLDVRLKTTFGEALQTLLSAEMVQIFGQNCALMAFQDVTDRRRSEAELYEAIETVMKDTTWFTQSVIERIATLRRPVRPGITAPEIGDLTPREREVLGFISHGMTDRDIAEKLGLTRCTVRNHVAALYGKIGVHSRSSAIVWARERGVNLSWPPRGAANALRDVPSQRLGAIPIKNRARP
jgi:PAS domain S-box-containing protein